MGIGIDFEALPESVQRELFAELNAKFKRTRQASAVTKEQKVKAHAEILRCLNGFTLAQQRSILLWTISVIEVAQHRFYRDGDNGKGKKGKA